jgi:hypothetical protein
MSIYSYIMETNMGKYKLEEDVVYTLTELGKNIEIV